MRLLGEGETAVEKLVKGASGGQFGGKNWLEERRAVVKDSFEREDFKISGGIWGAASARAPYIFPLLLLLPNLLAF